VAGVEGAILQKRRGVDSAVAGPEGPPGSGDHPAIAVAAVEPFLLLVADGAIPHATGRAARDVSHLPAVGQLDFIRCPSAVAGHKVVVSVAIGVAAEAADGASIGVREDDAGVAVPVEADPQAEGGAGEAVDAAVVELELVLLGERELHEGTVDLKGGRGGGGLAVAQGGEQLVRNRSKSGFFGKKILQGEDFHANR